MKDLLPIDVETLRRQLAEGIGGEVRLDRLSRALYATDASIYQQSPVAVVVPRDEADVAHALAVARRHGIPLLPRGAGTSLAGQATISAGLVIDFSKGIDAILEIDEQAGWVRVQPGLVRDQLNAALAPRGLQFAPETATSNRATIGGMIGNNSAGTRSLRYGQTSDHVLELTVLLASGERLVLARRDRRDWDELAGRRDREGEIHRVVGRVIAEHRDEIAARYPKVTRSVGGYRLDVFVGDEPWSLVDLVVGSEGTLCTVVEAKLRIEPLPRAAGLCVVHFDQLMAALDAVPGIVDRGVPDRAAARAGAAGLSAVELLDRTVIEMARGSFGPRWHYRWLEGDPEAVLLVEHCGDDAGEVRAGLEALTGALDAQGIGYARPIVEGEDAAEVWEVRKAGLGLLAAVKGPKKPTAFIEDAAVPLPRLSQYVREILDACRDEGVRVSLYAHASVGLLHVRPMLDLKQADDIARMKRISERSCELVIKHGGTISGEHGDGRVRGWLLERLYGEAICGAFGEIKRAFDPLGLMNPNNIVEPPPIDANLRYGPGRRAAAVQTFYRYPEAGGLLAAAELCTGVGACRKLGQGGMCPSFMATRDEQDSTRGRANALRLALSGELGAAGLSSEELHAVFELCLSCKACKSECPSNVDVARLKSEFLAAYRERHGERLADRFVGESTRAAGLVAGRLAPLANWLGQRKALRGPMERLVGVDRRRPLPAFAREPFGRWFARHRKRHPEIYAGAASERQPVALFLDTYLSYHQPRVGRAAVTVLEVLGFRPEPLAAGCCCRPQISKGYLAEARETGGQTMRNIGEALDRGLKVVVCEPGCYSALVDDLPDLIDDAGLGQRVVQGVVMIDHFLLDALAGADLSVLEARGRQRAAVGGEPPRYLIHGHCHQKALCGTAPTRALLARFSGGEVAEIDAGCCGMAGSFGYDPKHYDLSLKIAEERLFPAIRAAPPDTRLVACGFSCRHQIKDGLGRDARHLVEELAELIAESQLVPRQLGSDELEPPPDR